jgi:phage terminase small subunit
MAAKLTPKQRKFADYYIELGNATEAARKAGYSQKTAKQIGQENLTKPDLKFYIDERLKELQSAKVADQQEIIEFLTSVMRGELKEETLYGVGMGEQSVREIELSGKERLKAAELLGKRYSLWTDRTEITGEVVTIVDDLTDDDLENG